MSIYTIRRRDADPQTPPRMVKADRLHQVESYLLGEYDIERLKDVAEAAEYGKAGVAVEDVSEPMPFTPTAEAAP